MTRLLASLFGLPISMRRIWRVCSFVDGVSSPEALVEASVRLELDAIMLTDHNGMCGWRGVRGGGSAFRPRPASALREPVQGVEYGRGGGVRVVGVVQEVVHSGQWHPARSAGVCAV